MVIPVLSLGLRVKLRNRMSHNRLWQCPTLLKQQRFSRSPGCSFSGQAGGFAATEMTPSCRTARSGSGLPPVPLTFDGNPSFFFAMHK